MFLLAGACLPLLCACKPMSIGGNGGSPHKVIRDLRVERENLLKQKQELKKQLALRDSEIATLKKRLDARPSNLANLSSEDFPHVVKIQFKDFSGGVDTDRDGVDDTIRAYLQTLDQRGRFFPAVGRAKVVIKYLNGDKPAQLIAEKVFDPDEVNESYRSGLLGAHYRLDVKLQKLLPADIKELSLQVTFTDAASGVDFAYSELVPIRKPQGPVGKNEAKAVPQQ